MRRLLPLLALSLLGGSPRRACPHDMVPLAEGCIDRYEWPNIPGEKPLIAVSAVPESEDVATGIVMDAESLCASVGKRLCYEDEWVEACEGVDGSKYPFGSKVPRYTPGDGTGLCNYDKVYRDVDERKVFLRDEQELRRLDQSEPSGSRETCLSAVGAFDMMGSVEEWVRTRAGGYVLAGRFWAEPWACHSMVRAHAPNWHYYSTGSRCCLTF